MRAPLSVRIDDGIEDRFVTSKVKGLRFSRSAYGGYKDLTAQLVVPRDMLANLGPNAKILVSDGRSGKTMWQGNIDNPGRADGAAGQSFDLQAFGGAARLHSFTRGLGYIVRDAGIWERSGNSVPGAQTRTVEVDDDDTGLEVFANEGKKVNTGWRGEWITRAYKAAGLTVGSVECRTALGAGSDLNFIMSMMSGTSSGSLTARNSTPYSNVFPIRATPGANDTILALRVDRNGSTFTATDDQYFRFYSIVTRQRTYDDLAGNELASYTSGSIAASTVITDMLVRQMAPGADLTKATVAPTSFQIDTLDWLDGITMGDALEQLRMFEPDLWWTLYGDEFTSDIAWNRGDPRYVISKNDGGVEHPGETLTQANRVAVKWTDNKGREQTTIRTTTVPGLGYPRDLEPIDLPDGMGSTTNAQRIGDKALELANNPPKAGTAVVNRRIRDRWAGIDVMPHEIMPACTVQEQETGDLFRLTEVDYADEDGAATLTLGDPRPSMEQVIARSEATIRRSRRRR